MTFLISDVVFKWDITVIVKPTSRLVEIVEPAYCIFGLATTNAACQRLIMDHGVK
jgi:hypothetical protein